MQRSSVSGVALQSITWSLADSVESSWIESTVGLSELGIQLPAQTNCGQQQTLLVVADDHAVRVLVCAPSDLPPSIHRAFERLTGLCFHAGTAVSDQPNLPQELRADAARLNAWLGEYPAHSVSAASGLGHSHLPLQFELQQLATAGASVAWHQVLPAVSGFFERQPAAQLAAAAGGAQLALGTQRASLATLQRANLRLAEATHVTQIYAVGLS